jgi:GT2 family glycosyltransferase
VSRPEISVVMPFAGSVQDAEAAIDALLSLDARPGDELILVDNSGTAAAASVSVRTPDAGGRPGPGPELTVIDAGGRPRPGPKLTVVDALGERSPAHARNVGAAQAHREWVLFLDADIRPLPGLLDAFFAVQLDNDVGAVAGEVIPARGEATLAARYGAARSFLGQRAHQEHPYRPRAAAANLLVRRAAFEQLGGFYEGVRAAEDTDFTWRLQEAGWRLGLREEAKVEHRYRASVSELRRQWRGYAAGRAWLARRYDGFAPQPAVRRALHRGRGRIPGLGGASADGGSARAGRRAAPVAAGPVERGRFIALDALLSLEELAGLALSNRPSEPGARRGRADVVLVADRFPARGDPLVELAGALERARVEALARPAIPDPVAGRRLAVDYLEDDGAASRLTSVLRLALRHPLRTGYDLFSRPPEAPSLRSLAPAVRRLEHDAGARVHALGPGRSAATAQRLARLAGRPLDR